MGERPRRPRISRFHEEVYAGRESDRDLFPLRLRDGTNICSCPAELRRQPDQGKLDEAGDEHQGSRITDYASRHKAEHNGDTVYANEPSSAR